MFLEIGQFFLTRRYAPQSAHLFIASSVGLWSRGRRCRKSWQPHADRTRAFILQNAPSSVRTVAVLGSGPLFDVPLAHLSAQATQVLLIDRMHLFSTQRFIRRFPNVKMLWRDLSENTEPHALDFLTDIPDLDWVISVNLVSQLAISAPQGRERSSLDAHLDQLARFACTTTLITDVDYGIEDRKGQRIRSTDLCYGRQMPEPDARWLWPVAPFGEEARATRRVHTVYAYSNWG